MNATRHLDGYLDPEFPIQQGEDGAVIFAKDGREYRLMRANEGVWVIHQRGVPPEKFQLEISNVTSTYIDVVGRGHLGPLHALGATRTELFTKLF